MSLKNKANTRPKQALTRLGQVVAQREECALLEPFGRRFITRQEVALHLNLTPTEFELHYLTGHISPPVEGRELWDLATLTLLKRRPDRRREKRPGVYVIRYSTFVKIGVSDDIPRRLESLQDSLPGHIEIIAILDGRTRKQEYALHLKFAPYRVKGEWYRPEGALALWIEGGCK